MDVIEEQTSCECYSGCESGWTAYLGSSDEKQCSIVMKECGWREEAGYGQEDDLSMVSDASSGPPMTFLHEEEKSLSCLCCTHHHHGEICFGCSLFSPPKKRRLQSGHHHQNQHSGGCHHPLDDTATSHLSAFSEKSSHLMEASYSSTASNFKESTQNGHLDLLRPTSPRSRIGRGKRAKNGDK